MPNSRWQRFCAASFPGAFPPAQLGEVERVLERRGQKWAGKARFLKGNFRPYLKAGADPEKTSFIDGAVLNNKPFAPAIEAIGRQPALREVDRRLVYINPNPAGRPPPPTGKPPGMLRTLRAALSDIPRNEPISDDQIKPMITDMMPFVKHTERDLLVELHVLESHLTAQGFLVDLLRESGAEFTVHLDRDTDNLLA